MTMGRLGGAIDRLATGVYVVTRYAPSTYVGGRHSIGAASAFSISAVITPLSDKELQRLPEGQRSIARIAILTRTQMQTGKAGAGGFVSDVVTYRGAPYELEEIEPWDAGGYFRCVARKKPL